MSDKIGEKILPDEDKERRRQTIEDALLAFRPGVVREFGDLIRREVPTREQALANLEAADVSRVLKHRAIIDGLLRTRDRDQTGLWELGARVLYSTIDQDQEILAPRVEVESAIEGMMRNLVALTPNGGARLQQIHWERWVGTTSDIFHFTTPEKTFQACNDSQSVIKGTPGRRHVQSRLIVAEFWSDLPPSAFAVYVDPRNWPTCSVFWEAMRELQALQSKEDPPRGYDCDFEETVKIFGEVLKVPLQVAFRQRPDQSRVWTRFNIARRYHTSSVPVDVDTGTVSAESMPPGGPAPTRVQATKYLHWSDPNRPDFTHLACDFGWCELMAEMANACLEGVPTPPLPGANGTTVDDAIKRFVDDVMIEWRNGIGDYTPHLQNLIRRFAGPSWNARWINDLLAMGKVTVDRSGNVASHVRRLAESLQAAGDRKDDDE
jgi:hypothetical protein